MGVHGFVGRVLALVKAARLKILVGRRPPNVTAASPLGAPHHGAQQGVAGALAAPRFFNEQIHKIHPAFAFIGRESVMRQRISDEIAPAIRLSLGEIAEYERIFPENHRPKTADVEPACGQSLIGVQRIDHGEKALQISGRRLADLDRHDGLLIGRGGLPIAAAHTNTLPKRKQNIFSVKAGAMKARIHITLKNGVLDPEGKAIENALSGLGFAGASDVRQGKVIEMTLAETSEADARAKAEDMCKKLLANPVMENYAIEILA